MLKADEKSVNRRKSLGVGYFCIINVSAGAMYKLKCCLWILSMAFITREVGAKGRRSFSALGLLLLGMGMTMFP